MKCAACNKELTRKEAMFTKEREPYCPNPFECEHMDHPNSVQNIVARGGAVTLFTDEQVQVDTIKNLNVSPEMMERIQKVATKPQSIRLNRQDISYYLLKLQETQKMASISEAVRYCVNYTMEHAPIEDKPLPPIVEQTKGVHGALTGIVIPDIPVRDPISNPVPIDEEESFGDF
jgi:hypothetical protein